MEGILEDEQLKKMVQRQPLKKNFSASQFATWNGRSPTKKANKEINGFFIFIFLILRNLRLKLFPPIKSLIALSLILQ